MFKLKLSVNIDTKVSVQMGPPPRVVYNTVIFATKSKSNYCSKRKGNDVPSGDIFVNVNTQVSMQMGPPPSEVFIGRTTSE